MKERTTPKSCPLTLHMYQGMCAHIHHNVKRGKKNCKVAGSVSGTNEVAWMVMVSQTKELEEEQQQIVRLLSTCSPSNGGSEVPGHLQLHGKV